MSSSASSLTNPITFSGQSTFSSSFQQVLQRAVGIASLPMDQLEGEINTLQGQQSDLYSMQSTFGSLQNALQSISTAVTGGVSANSSDNSVVEAAAQSNTLPGNYSITVNNVGSSTTTISGAGSPAVTDPSKQNISSSLSYTLTVNNTPHTITLANGNLNGLANAINDANDGVSATIVNLGSNSSPDYRLAVTSTELGPDSIQLSDGTNNTMLSVVGQPGALAQYQVNGNSKVLTSTSDQITLAPGLTATLISAAPNETVNITVAANENALSSALSSFATAYNAAVSALGNERGQNGGALKGESLVYEMQGALSQIAQFASTSGSVGNLSDLGLDLDSTGNLTFNASQFNAQNAAGIQQFLGGLTSGGFLQTANNALNGITDPTAGMLTNEINAVTTSITNQQNQISDDQTRVNTLEANLQKQLSQADAAIAVLQQQNTMFTSLLQTENANNIAGLS